MVDLKDFITLMDELSPLYQKKKEEEERLRVEGENTFSALCEELRSLYEGEKSRIYQEYIYPFISENSFLNENSSLYIIGKKKWETYHSLFLKYLWDSQTKLGNIAFQNFLQGIGMRGSWLDSISKNSYFVKEEHNTGKQRKIDLRRKKIDLLFVDEENKWLIVVENKIDSKVHNDKSSNRSQLEIYRDYCEREFQGYHKEYILLSYTEKNKNNSDSGWRYANYYQLFRSLFPFRFRNALLDDYLKTLFCLLFSKEQWEDDYENVSLYRCMSFYNNIISKI